MNTYQLTRILQKLKKLSASFTVGILCQANSFSAAIDNLNNDQNTAVNFRSASGYFRNVQNLGPEINSSRNEFGVNISSDGLTMLLYSARSGGFGDVDIWMATRAQTTSDSGDPEKFANLTNLGGGVNTGFYEAGPHLSPDEQRLYFASDRPNGHGDVDIYMAVRTESDQSFHNPVNLGAGVNSSWRDAGPILSSDERTIYFQSERPGGLGGRDIWMATRQALEDEMGNPVPFGDATNVGPLNSPETEYLGSLSADELTYFFGSTRPGGHGRIDMWMAVRATTSEPFGQVENLGPWLNSEFFEFTPTVSKSWPEYGSKIYFGATRAGQEDGDIFEATWTPLPTLEVSVLDTGLQFRWDSKTDSAYQIQLIKQIPATEGDGLENLGPRHIGTGETMTYEISSGLFSEMELFFRLMVEPVGD